MKIEGLEDVAVPRDDAWRMLNDPAVLKRCTPGLERLDETAPEHYEAEIALALPLVTGRFQGSVDFLERLAPERLRLKLQGKGAPGFVSGEATITLAPSEKGTEFRYEAEVQIGGQIARLGQRMLSGVTKEMAGQFFEALEAQAAAAPAAAPSAGSDAASSSSTPVPARPAAPSPFFAALQLLWRTLLNLLGLSKRS